MAKKAKRISASQSFTPSEVAWMDQLLRTVLRGGDVRAFATSDLMSKWMRKVQTMRQTVERSRVERKEGEDERSTEGS